MLAMWLSTVLDRVGDPLGDHEPGCGLHGGGVATVLHVHPDVHRHPARLVAVHLRGLQLQRDGQQVLLRPVGAFSVPLALLWALCIAAAVWRAPTPVEISQSGGPRAEVLT